ncbi:MAG: hypothetical protein LBM16_04225 [Clostridiales bacterium]|jgi:hypothetical protein|nr:hypothetical protein [Clostridiales bacterium]
MKTNFIKFLIKYMFYFNIILSILCVALFVGLFMSGETVYKPYVHTIIAITISWLSYILLIKATTKH